MPEWGTIGLAEILYTLAALPGLGFWFRNYLYARGTERMVRHLPANDGRSLWARFSVLLTRVFIGVEGTFLFIGGYAMFIPQSPNGDFISRVVLTTLLIAANAVIGFLGVRWKFVDDALADIARKRLAKIKGD